MTVQGCVIELVLGLVLVLVVFAAAGDQVLHNITYGQMDEETVLYMKIRRRVLGPKTGLIGMFQGPEIIKTPFGVVQDPALTIGEFQSQIRDGFKKKKVNGIFHQAGWVGP